MNMQDFIVSARIAWKTSDTYAALQQAKADFFQGSMFVNNQFVMNMARKYQHTEFV